MIPYTIARPLYLARTILALSFTFGIASVFFFALIKGAHDGRYFISQYVLGFPYSIVFICNCLTVSTIVSLNAYFDRSKVEFHEAQIVEKFTEGRAKLRSDSFKKASTRDMKYVYQLPRLPYSPFSNQIEDITNLETFDRMDMEKDRVRVRIKRGRFGIPWYSQQDVQLKFHE